MFQLNDKEFMGVNLKRWNELVDINVKSKSYDLEGFVSGKTSLLPIELEELGDVNGKSLLHLQCHFGMDTLSWAKLGAKVTGIDFSEKAINLARELSIKLKIPANFIESNIYDIPNVLDEKFDIVFTSYGTICWLPDLEKWAQIISNCLKPEGIFYIIDGHPFGFIIDEKQDPFIVGFNYFPEGKPVFFEGEGAYADPSADIHFVAYEWSHSLGDVVNALISAGLRIEFLREFDYSDVQSHPFLIQSEDGWWRFQNLPGGMPLMFSIRAIKG